MISVEGWISDSEIQLVEKYMKQNSSILEIGCAVGKLFSNLYPKFPNCKYTVVEPFEEEKVRLQLDWNKGYFDKDNLGDYVTRSAFQKNCPYANINEMYFENYNSTEKFDIISLGLVGSKVDWLTVYKKTSNLVTNNGFIIGRNYNHPKYGPSIHEAINLINGKIIDSDKGSFVLRIENV